MSSQEIVKWDESKWLVATSASFLPSAYFLYQHEYYIQCYFLLWTTFCSMNYWRNATYGKRRQLDLICSKIAFFVFLYDSTMYLHGYGLVCWPNLAAIIYCYLTAKKLFESTDPNWLYYHMLFHILVGIQGYIITSYL
jgi:hypothetical protein